LRQRDGKGCRDYIYQSLTGYGIFHKYAPGVFPGREEGAYYYARRKSQLLTVMSVRCRMRGVLVILFCCILSVADSLRAGGKSYSGMFAGYAKGRV